MRGTPVRKVSINVSHGIIPAHAGNTSGVSCRVIEAQGSSPRMRGTRYVDCPQNVQARIIPAHAGNTAVMLPLCPYRRDHPRACGEHFDALERLESWWDHPRACGEHVCLPSQPVMLWGSSPRMRGTPEDNVNSVMESGIIPAHAGNTCCSPCSADSPRDHPRACGEHGVPHCAHHSPSGSSPRMRGTLSAVESVFEQSGIIPAHAGNTG